MAAEVKERTIQTGLNLVQKWIERNQQLGLSEDMMDGHMFVFGNTVYQIHKTGQGEFQIEHKTGRLLIFRDSKILDDEFTCRICGMEHESKIDTIRCCMNEDE